MLQEECGFSPKLPGEGSTQRSQHGRHCQDSDPREGVPGLQPGVHTCLQVSLAAKPICLTWEGNWASCTNPQLLPPAVQTRKGKKMLMRDHLKPAR